MSLPFWFFQIFHNKNVTYVLQFSSVAQSCPNLCNPMNCSMPGLPVHHQRENTMIISFRTQPISKSTDFFISQIEKPSFQILQHQLCQRDTHLCELVNNRFLIKILYLHLSNTFRMGGGMMCEPPYTWTHARVHTHTHTHTHRVILGNVNNTSTPLSGSVWQLWLLESPVEIWPLRAREARICPLPSDHSCSLYVNDMSSRVQSPWLKPQRCINLTLNFI